MASAGVGRVRPPPAPPGSPSPGHRHCNDRPIRVPPPLPQGYQHHLRRGPTHSARGRPGGQPAPTRLRETGRRDGGGSRHAGGPRRAALHGGGRYPPWRRRAGEGRRRVERLCGLAGVSHPGRCCGVRPVRRRLGGRRCRQPGRAHLGYVPSGARDRAAQRRRPSTGRCRRAVLAAAPNPVRRVGCGLQR